MQLGVEVREEDSEITSVGGHRRRVQSQRRLAVWSTNSLSLVMRWCSVCFSGGEVSHNVSDIL